MVYLLSIGTLRLWWFFPATPQLWLKATKQYVALAMGSMNSDMAGKQDQGSHVLLAMHTFQSYPVIISFWIALCFGLLLFLVWTADIFYLYRCLELSGHFCSLPSWSRCLVFFDSSVSLSLVWAYSPSISLLSKGGQDERHVAGVLSQAAWSASSAKFVLQVLWTWKSWR